MLRKSIVRLSIATFTGMDKLESMPVSDLTEVANEVTEVFKELGKK